MKYYKEAFDFRLECPVPTSPPLSCGSLKEQRERASQWYDKLAEWDIRFEEWKVAKENNNIHSRFDILDL